MRHARLGSFSHQNCTGLLQKSRRLVTLTSTAPSPIAERGASHDAVVLSVAFAFAWLWLWLVLSSTNGAVDVAEPNWQYNGPNKPLRSLEAQNHTKQRVFLFVFFFAIMAQTQDSPKEGGLG